MKTTHGILEFYRFIFGSVPFDEINLVEVPALGFGQSPAGMIWLTREAFDSLHDETNRLVAGFGAVGGWVNRLVAHELAHQYWAHNLKAWGMEDQWLNEGFAEYTSALAIRAMRKKGVGTYDIIVRDWGETAKKASYASCIPTANLLSPNPDKGDLEEPRFRHYLLYNKGAYLLACLHKELGEQQFYLFLRKYMNKYAWYPPSYIQDVPDLLKEMTGKDYNAWFDKYLWGTEMPELKP
jgi:aminopeptidase N